MPGAVETTEDRTHAYNAAQKVVEVHRALADFLAHGMTLARIDRFVHETLDALGCVSCFHRYKPGRMPPFPSQACLSVNECIVHGTAGYLERPMVEGDVLSIDIGVKHKGWIGDAAWTYVFGGMTEEVKRLTDAGKESLREGIRALRPENTYMAWASTVQRIVEHEHGFHMVRGLGGHGIGRKLHLSPWISNVVPSTPGEWPDGYTRCAPGTIVAVEPMLAVGTGEVSQKPRDWPIYTADGSLSVHYEHDVLITEGDPEVLSRGLDELEDVITR